MCAMHNFNLFWQNISMVMVVIFVCSLISQATSYQMVGTRAKYVDMELLTLIT